MEEGDTRRREVGGGDRRRGREGREMEGREMRWEMDWREMRRKR